MRSSERIWGHRVSRWSLDLVKKPLSLRFHQCPCGVGPVQRDLYSAFLASTLSADHLIPSCAQAAVPWESAEARLQAAHERVLQRANEGQPF